MKPSADPRRVILRLLHDGTQPGPPVTESVRFGAQDTAADVHPATNGHFNLPATVKPDAGGAPVFSSPFCHGPPKARFLYLSWKRIGEYPAPWAWRIKIPLSGIDWAMIEAASQPDRVIQADVNGRRPHVTAPIAWRIVKA